MTDDEREIEIDVETEGDRSVDESSDDGTPSEGEFETAPWRRDSSLFEDSDGSRPRDLEDELGRVDVMSTPEGYVEGRVTDLETVDETTVRLEVALPHGRTTSFELEKPIPWSEEYLLARIVEDVGYDAASVGHLVGESVYLARADREHDADEWDGLRGTAARAAGRTVNSLLEASLGGRFERTGTGPTWRLVDPPERPDPVEKDGFDALSVSIALGLVLAGVLVAAAGAVFGATGGVAVSSAMVAYALPGVIIALVGGLVAYSLDGNGE